jgi:nucleotide-binding universal stress UspA family protein
VKNRYKEVIKMFAPKRILVPTDFTEDSDRALREAIEIARPFHAKIFLLHVDERVPVVGGDYVISAQTVRAVEKEDERISKAMMSEEIRKVVTEADVEIETEERHGLTHEEILGYGVEKGVDLIVIEPHARRGLKNLLGGITDRLLREAPCPLLILPRIH